MDRHRTIFSLRSGLVLVRSVGSSGLRETTPPVANREIGVWEGIYALSGGVFQLAERPCITASTKRRGPASKTGVTDGARRSDRPTHPGGIFAVDASVRLSPSTRERLPLTLDYPDSLIHQYRIPAPAADKCRRRTSPTVLVPADARECGSTNSSGELCKPVPVRLCARFHTVRTPPYTHRSLPAPNPNTVELEANVHWFQAGSST